MKILKQLRKERKITAKQLAETLNVAESTVSLYENGKREPDFKTLLNIAHYFGVSVDYLLENTEAPQSANKPMPITQILNNKECRVLIAYRSTPEMQSAVDKLLGVSEDNDTVTLYTAAKSSDNHPPKIAEISREKWEVIDSAPDTDEDLV